jgi:ABC-type sugar transport system substrate-binding protein
MEARAAEVGASVESEYGNSTPERQVEQIQNALTKQPDFLAITPVDPQSTEPVLRQAKEQQIPVIATGDTVEEPELIETFVNSSPYKIGQQKAEYIVEQLEGKGTVGIVHGIHGLTYSDEQAKAFSAVFAKNPGIKVVDAGYAGGFSSDLGLERTENLLTRDPELNAILFDNDELALGGVKALKQAGIEPGKVLIVSSDGTTAALQAVRRGEINYTVSLCGYAQGIETINIIGEILEGKTVPKEIVSKTLAYTPENIAELSKKPRSFCN